MHLSLEQKIEKINRYRPIDDIYLMILNSLV